MFGPLAGGHTSNFGAIWGIDVSVALIAFALSPSPFIPDIMGPMPNQSLDKAKLLPRITQAENGIGERSSELFDEDGVNAEEIRRGHAQTDQAEHVELPRDEGAPAAFEERPARPENDRCRERGFEALRPRDGHQVR